MIPGSIRKVLVVGLGKVTGEAVAQALVELGREVRVAELVDSVEHRGTAGRLAEFGVEVQFGVADLALVEWADLVVPSPGVAPVNPLIRAALERGVPVWSEVEVGARLARGPVVAITGTNGKTTVTSLLAAVLNAAGVDCVAAGNIGFPLVKAAREGPAGRVLVAEVSSFQLAFVDEFRPRVAVVLNVADDHYDWHAGYGDYFAAKARITENQGPEDFLLVGAHSDAALSIGRDSKAGLGLFGREDPATLRRLGESKAGRAPVSVAGLAGDAVVISSGGPDFEVVGVADIRLQGPHNLENVMAAALAAFHSGADAPSINKAVAGFEGLPHRMSLVAEIKGVRYIDDSKATNPHAALAALEGLDGVVLIAGGRAKGLDLSILAGRRAALKGLVAVGEAAAELEKVFEDLPTERASTMEEAVERAAQTAAPGDTVLLSPACSSLDQYADYAERGERFAKAVMSL